ncbi:MAG TPA: calcium-binding protein, partial [Allosphingosinicella sp.]
MADINGTAGADLLFGAAAGDLISGGDGNDLIFGGAGDDELRGGEGDDILEGETGDDRLDGGAGHDRLTSADQGDDVLLGGDGDDILVVGRTDAGDTLALDGGAGSDRLIFDLNAVAAAVTAAAGDGDDSVEIYAIQSGLSLSLGAGRDLVTLIGFRTWVQGGGRVTIADFQAGAAGDRIGLSSLTGGDLSNWNPATNPFAGGYLKAAQSGADVVISASFTANGTFVDAVTLQNVLLSSLTPDNLGGWTWDGSAVPAQTITGTAAAETLRGNGGADEIHGLDGDDILEGHAGADLLWGGEGNDILRGGQGSDQVHGGAGNDTLAAESGGDVLHGEDGDDRLTLSAVAGSAGTLTGWGGAGSDSIVIFGSSATASFSADAGTGDDVVSITVLASGASIALGDGRDRLDLDSWFAPAPGVATIEVTDFATGDGGDRLDWTSFLMRLMPGWWGSDLYTEGALRLLQSGADTLLQLDLNGGGDQFVTLIAFRATTATAFTTYNLGGIGPAGLPADGATITGTADPDRLLGTDGGDVIEGLDGRDVLTGFHGDDTLLGGAGDDTLLGYDGDDALEGGDGNDVFNGGRGDDLIDGGEGNDVLNDSGSGSKGFLGGAGDDSAYFYRGGDEGGVFVGSGGDGNDYFFLQSSGFNGTIIVADGGAGDDLFEVAGPGEFTLGAGQDRLRIVERPWFGEPPILVHDFAAGDAGDRLEFTGLFRHFTDFHLSANPFATGHLTLVGTDFGTYLMADLDGFGGMSSISIAVLAGVSRYSLTAHNLGGYATPWTTGTAAAETFQGDGGLNEFVGGGGNDIFLIGYGGKDVAVGGSGDDLFYVAAVGGFGPTVDIVGGGGSDLLQIQGKAAETRLDLTGAGGGTQDSVRATGIGTVQFLSGFDSSRGWGFNAPLKYLITLDNGFAPTGAPLVIDTTRLEASESFSIVDDSFRDADAVITLIGGAGVDQVAAGAGGTYLDGGAGDDALHTGAGPDTLLGGAGSDRLHSNLTNSRSGLDYLDGGDGDDVIALTGGAAGLWSTSTIKGGVGDDLLTVDVSGGPGVANADLGTGNDRVQLRSALGTFNLTLGAGSDTIEILPGPLGGLSVGENVAVADFTVGPGGDSLVWQGALNAYLAGSYSGGMNPFQSGHARLIQDGGDVLLQLSRLADGNFRPLLRLQNHLVADFAGGLGGFVPAPPNGTAGDDILVGTDGRDDFDGLAGNDIIDGGGGGDRMAGGSGDDIFYVDHVEDLVVESYNGGTDEVRTGLASFSLGPLGDVENLRGTSNAGQTLTGNELANRIVGGAGDDVLNGKGGNDVLDGGPGADRMEGDSGYDIFFVDDVNDVITETGVPSFDEVRTSLAAYSLVGTPIENLTATSNIAHEFRGNSSVNILTGGAGNDLLLLQDGSEDVALGGDGNDVLYFGSALSISDVANGGAGRDVVVLQGNVTAVLIDASLVGIESISLQSGATTRFGDTANNSYDYDLTTADGNVAVGVQLIVNAQSLRVGEDFTFDGSAESDGRFLVYGGHGVDDLTGGDGADAFFFEGQRWGADDKVN